MKKIFIIIISLFLLTGCGDYQELENLGITSSLFISYDTDYKIIAEIYDGDKQNYVVSTGSTISEAIHNFDFKSEKSVYLNHLNAIIIDKNVLLEDIIYYFLRNPNVNQNFYLVISENVDFYESNKNIGLQIKNICERLKYDEFFTFAKNYLNKNKDIVIPFMDDDILLNTLYTYDEDKLINKLDDHFTFIYSILTKKKSNETIKVLFDDDYITLAINSIENNIKVDKNIKLTLCIEATILEKDESIDTSNTNTITRIEKVTNEYLKNEIIKFIDALKEDKTDILGLDVLINNKYKKLDKKFDEYSYDIEVKVNINKKGQLLK